MDPDQHPSATVVIFAKAPVAGFAKTRLIPRLGPEGAARLQADLISRTIRTAVDAGIGPVHLWCAPDCTHPAFADLACQYPIMLREQRSGTLGDRMHGAFLAEAGEGPVLLIGVDCPPLGVEHLRVCARELARKDAVYLPAEDGGYVLVGLRRPDPHVFADVPWGGAAVMEITRQRLRQRNLSWTEPATLWDLDRPEDFERWEAFRNGII
ncbi:MULTISPECIES: TIGR04282 family arsenosugar biosynthesis glycosyltransferase [Hyphomicrobiales]|uniref:TIGR04282 family arsenosugar biosynthesis glycosyltransferase n=1 Tax=Xanthobacter autotrophicus TaxID=280 RepID=UPI0037279182